MNQTNLLLERGQLRIPHHLVDETLKRQMLKFRVTKVTENGIPRYSTSDEHALDAMIFALYGFMEKHPELINIVEEVEPATHAHVVKANFNDPIKEKIKEVAENKSSSSELKTHSSRARPGFSRRGGRSTSNTNALGWGRRGFSPTSKRTRI